MLKYKRTLELIREGVTSKLILQDINPDGKVTDMEIHESYNDFAVVYININTILKRPDHELYVVGSDRNEIHVPYKKTADAMIRHILLEAVPYEQRN